MSRVKTDQLPFEIRVRLAALYDHFRGLFNDLVRGGTSVADAYAKARDEAQSDPKPGNDHIPFKN